MKDCLESHNLFYVKLFTKWVMSVYKEKYNLSSDIKNNNLQSIVKEWAKIAQIALCCLSLMQTRLIVMICYHHFNSLRKKN